MSLSCFVPANTQKARTTGISAFERMLKEENVSMDVIQACILRDKTGKTLAAVMDRFGYHLATYEGKKVALVMQEAPCASPREDRKVARVLSGWKPNETPSIADISVLDHGAQECLARMQELLFGSCMGLENTKLNVSRKVIGVLTAYLIKYLPQMKTLAPESLYIVRIMECLDAASISLAEMLAWSSALTAITAGPERDHKLHDSKPNSCKSECHHAALINELIESNRLMTARLLALEAAVLQQTTGHKATTQPTQTEDLSEQQPKPKRRKKAATNLSSMWFEWYTRLPRVWDSSDRQKKSDYRLVVAYMKLFLDGGFQLCEDAPDYKDRVLAVGQQAESAVLA
ncbi:Hypothetical protein PHPALM_3776 [Phytophthora palmivora]|uniref:Uncharacterized protein n=1 Tax=Phytophthora palmivora TaxID=4796 RepID=A0A2P4YLH9_9STRA|nr:Hypothetical protein PHPALM_3776 [Phytophthora palmivora]